MTDLPADAIRVVATLPIVPESIEPARAALKQLAAASLAAEPGCLQYDVYESAGAKNVLVTVEAWASDADMKAHLSTPHVAEAFGVLGGALAGDLAIHPLKPL
jgi:quinol monooxygenase YgiN